MKLLQIKSYEIIVYLKSEQPYKTYFYIQAYNDVDALNKLLIKCQESNYTIIKFDSINKSI